MKKIRLDQLLVEKNLVPSRQKARSVIMSGNVFIDGLKKEKPGEKVDLKSNIFIKSNPPYVSRGGVKLEHAISSFGISVKEKIVIDVGSSTGGFVDCLLKKGAARVIAVDVGYGQLDWSLRNDSRVVVMEKTNVKYITNKDLPERADLATVDVSFISILKVFPVLSQLGINEVIALIKPQFEAGKNCVGKKGVVREPATHLKVLSNVKHNDDGYLLNDLAFSPIKGPKGNIEFLAYFRKDKAGKDIFLDKVVEEAHLNLI